MLMVMVRFSNRSSCSAERICVGLVLFGSMLAGTHRALAQNAGGTPTEARASIRAFLESIYAPDRAWPSSFILETRVDRESELDEADVERRLAEVQDFPDHPELARLERHQWIQRGERDADILVARGGQTVWFYDFSETGLLRGRAGEVRDRRWVSLDLGDLVAAIVVHEGVPFPATKDVGPWFGEARRWAADVFFYGISARDLRVADIRPGETWSAAMIDPETGEDVAVIEGGWLAGEPVMRSYMFVGDGARSDLPVSRYRDHRRVEGFERAIPFRKVSEPRLNERETIMVKSIESVPSERVAEMAAPPSADEVDSLEEYSSARVTQEQPRKSLLVWERGLEGWGNDVRYLVVPPEVSAALSNNEAEAEAESELDGDSNNDSRGTAVVPVLLVAAGLITCGVGVFVYRRFGELMR